MNLYFSRPGSQESPARAQKLVVRRAFGPVLAIALVSCAFAIGISIMELNRQWALMMLAAIATIAIGAVLILLNWLAQALRLEASRASFIATLFDTIDIEIIACDAEGNATHANQRALRRLGQDFVGSKRERGDVIVQSLFEADGETPLTPERLPLRRTLQEGSIREVEVIAANADERLFFEVNGSALRNERGHVVGAVVTSHDVTVMRNLRAQLEAHAKHLQRTLDIRRAIETHAGDFDATVESATQWAQQVTGAEGASLELIDGEYLVHTGTSGSLSSIVGRRTRFAGSWCGLVVEIGKPQYCGDILKNNLIHHDAASSLNARSMALAPVKHREQIVGALCVVSSEVDAFGADALLNLEVVADGIGSALTASKMLAENQELLARIDGQRQLYERLLTALSDVGEGVTIVEGDRLVYANDAFCELVGYSLDELLAKDSVFSMISGENSREQWDLMRSSISNGTLSGLLQTVILAKNGEEIDIEFSSKRIDLDGKEQRVNVIRDVRMRLEWERSLAERADALLLANEELKHVEEMRADFAAAVSHDFRTPLTSIVGYLELIKETPDDEPLSSVAIFLKRIDKASQELRRRVETFLDFSRAERSDVELECEPASIDDIVSSVVDSLNPFLSEHDLVLEVEPACLALIEKSSFARVVENLLTNAVKYSPAESQIVVRVLQAEKSVRVEVQDRGRGVAPDDIERIFESYYRASDVGGAIRGTGIGLAVARQLVEVMGGRIWVENRPGGGSIFSVELVRVDAGQPV